MIHAPAPAPPTAPARASGSLALRGLLVLVLVFALREAKALLAPVVIAIVLTFVLGPLVQRLRRWGAPEAVAAALVVLALLASTVPLAASLATPAAAWLEKAPTTVAQALAQLDRLRAALPMLGPPAPAPPPARSGAARAAAPAAAPPAADPVKDRLASEGIALTGLVLGQGLSFLFSAAATLILLYFFLASEHWFLARCVEALPRRRMRALLLGGARSAQREIGHFLMTQGIVNIVVGVLTGLMLWLQGLPNPTLWGALTVVVCYIPYVGPLTLMLLLLAAGLSTFSSTAEMLGPMLGFGVIHALESNLVSPWIVSRRLALAPVSVVLSVLFWGWLWGIAGALIAVPMLIALRSVCRRVRRLRQLGRFLEGERHAPPSLRALLRRGASSARGVQPRPQGTMDGVSVETPRRPRLP